jgi:ABC-2 type transport system permease protein
LHTLDLYLRLLSLRIRSQLAYRLSFWFDILAAVITNSVGFITFTLVIQKFGGIAGWSLGEVAFLFGTVELSFGLMDMIFSGFDPQNFGAQVRLGLFDQLMLRPVSLTVQVLSSEFVLRRLGRIVEGLAVLVIAIGLAAIRWTPLKVIYLPLIILSMVCFFGGLFMIGATLSFWTAEGLEAMNIFTYGGTEMMSYPMSIYPLWMRRFFTYILPAMFLNYYPALYILGKPDPLGLPASAALLSPLAGLAVLAAALAFWHYGIRHYQSTGT